MSCELSIKFEKSGFYIFKNPGDEAWEFSVNSFYRPNRFLHPEFIVEANWPNGPCFVLSDLRTSVDLRERFSSLQDDVRKKGGSAFQICLRFLLTTRWTASSYFNTASGKKLNVLASR